MCTYMVPILSRSIMAADALLLQSHSTRRTPCMLDGTIRLQIRNSDCLLLLCAYFEYIRFIVN
uniref:Uncharacterized protein n=1 Tax=Manihot esculenta TaxID=3983 RepID=A0A2C9U1B7_MANES